MRTEIKTDSNATIFTLKEPQLNKGISSELKAEFLIQCPAEGDFILDLSHVKGCDSNGLSALLVAHRELERDNRVLKIAGAGKLVMTEIRTAQLHDKFEFYDSVQQARVATPKKKAASTKMSVPKKKNPAPATKKSASAKRAAPKKKTAARKPVKHATAKRAPAKRTTRKK